MKNVQKIPQIFYSTLRIGSWQGRAIIGSLLFAALLFFCQKESELPDSYVGKDVSTVLMAIPKNDREKLEYFFRELIGWGGFGYVLFGEKPMALDIVEEKINPFASLSAFRLAITPRRIKFTDGFKTWRKYEKFFLMSRFIFFYENDRRNNTLITLVNKTTFTQKVQQHAEDFKAVLNHDISAEELLKEGMHRPLLSEVFMSHDGLIGTLLGYGRDNAYLFHQRSQLTSEEEIVDFCEKFKFDSAWTDEEFEDFRKKFESVSWVSSYISGAHMKDLNLVALPGFGAVFDTPETQYLRRHYLQTKKTMIEFYRDKDFLEATLRILTSA